MAGKRKFLSLAFNRGLNLVDAISMLRPGQSYKAQNIVFERRSAMRREGSSVGYAIASEANSNGITLLKRFYDLAITGSIRKTLIMARDTVLRNSTSEWDELTETAGVFAALGLPSNQAGANTLYTGYSAADTVTMVSGALLHGFQAKSWMYLIPRATSADDMDDTVNVPMRVGFINAGYKTFLQGLVPPLSLAAADSEHGDVPTAAQWSFKSIVLVPLVAIGSQHISVSPDGNDHVVYIQDPVGGLPPEMYYSKRDGANAWLTELVTPDDISSCSGKIRADGTTMEVAAYYIQGGANELRHYRRTAGVWSNSVVDTASAAVGDENDLALDSKGNVHIAYRDTTLGDLKYATNASGVFVVETVDSSAASVGRYPSIRCDANDVPHISYWDDTNTRLKHAYREGIPWTVETVDTAPTNAAGVSSIAFQDNGAIGIAYAETVGGVNSISLWEKLDGTWTDRGAIDATFLPVFYISFEYVDGAEAVAVYDDNNTNARIAKGSVSTWSTAAIGATHINSGMAFDENTQSLHVIMLYEFVTANFGFDQMFFPTYHYKLTAEYDDGVLGESGPSSFAKVIRWSTDGEISANSVHNLDINDARYNMTDEVTRIHIYRTIEGEEEDSRYYRAGSVNCTLGVPSGDFADNVTDLDLVLEPLLDEDVFLPPKYRYGVFWKDRAVIAFTKARDTSDTTSLDVGDTADASIHRNRIRYSRAFQPDRFPQNFFQDILPDGESGSIAALIVHPVLDRLFVFMESDVLSLENQIGDGRSALSFTVRNIANASGTPAAKSIVYANGFMFYWTKDGIEVIDGYRGRSITSGTIGPLWREIETTSAHYADRINMAQIHQVAGVFDRKNERIYWAYASATSTTNDRILCMDLGLWTQGGYADGVFSIFTGLDISDWEVFDGEGDLGEIFGGKATNVTLICRVLRFPYKYEDNAVTPTVINIDLRLGLSDVERPDIIKSWRSLQASARGGTASTLTIKLDVNETASPTTLGTTFDASGVSVKRISTALPRVAIGARAGVQFQTADALTASQGPTVGFEIYDVALEYSPKSTRVRPHLA